MHEMKLQEEYFNYIKYGSKRIEIRLLDEKREKIKVSDIIKFVNIINSEELITKVIDKYVYDSFDELLSNHSIESLSTKTKTKENLKEELNSFYNKELQDTHKVVGIQIEVL